KVFTQRELHSRQEILIENYVKTLNIEASTMVQMVSRDILPAVTSYLGELSDTVLHLDKCHITNNSLLDTANLLSQLLDMAHQRNDKLQQLIDAASKLGEDLNAGLFYRD